MRWLISIAGMFVSVLAQIQRWDYRVVPTKLNILFDTDNTSDFRIIPNKYSDTPCRLVPEITDVCVMSIWNHDVRVIFLIWTP